MSVRYLWVCPMMWPLHTYTLLVLVPTKIVLNVIFYSGQVSFLLLCTHEFIEYTGRLWHKLQNLAGDFMYTRLRVARGWLDQCVRVCSYWLKLQLFVTFHLMWRSFRWQQKYLLLAGGLYQVRNTEAANRVNQQIYTNKCIPP